MKKVHTHTHIQTHRYITKFQTMCFTITTRDFAGPGAVLDSIVVEMSPSTALELGTYCGYSAVRISRLLPPATRLITVEMNSECAHVARQVIGHAGLQDKVRGHFNYFTIGLAS